MAKFSSLLKNIEIIANVNVDENTILCFPLEAFEELESCFVLGIKDCKIVLLKDKEKYIKWEWKWKDYISKITIKEKEDGQKNFSL